MPIYEEKLISPLAVRFTQQRIRTNFKDGRELQATIKEISVEPGTADYDIILKAPFPTIEIIRWSQNGRGKNKQEHWFSFDNRRLYCLQRVAAEYWPQRVGAVVEVLYADSGTIRKKLDSRSCGQAVSIGHAFAIPEELQEWSWRQVVKARAPPGNFALQAESAVQADEAKGSVGDLLNAPSSTSAVERLSVEVSAACNAASKPEPAVKEEVECKIQSDSSERSVGEDNALTKLIGQLLVLETQDHAKVPEEQLYEGADSNDTRDFEHPVKVEADNQNQREEPENDNSSLTQLIGQLLVLKSQEHAEAQEQSSEDARSTQLSEDSRDTDASSSEPELSTTAMSFESDSLSGTEEEHQMDKIASAQHALKRKAAREKSIQEMHADKEVQQRQAFQMAQAAQLQMARCQMSQWQMAQWQAAQMAHWQQTAAAYQAFQAAGAARW